jgi:hypothetical protein
MSALRSVAAAAATALIMAGAFVAAAASCAATPAQACVGGPTSTAPILKLETDASRWDRTPSADQTRVREPLPEHTGARSPVTVRFRWAERATGVNNAAADRDDDFIHSALAR